MLSRPNAEIGRPMRRIRSRAHISAVVRIVRPTGGIRVGIEAEDERVPCAARIVVVDGELSSDQAASSEVPAEVGASLQVRMRGFGSHDPVHYRGGRQIFECPSAEGDVANHVPSGRNVCLRGSENVSVFRFEEEVFPEGEFRIRKVRSRRVEKISRCTVRGF